MTTTPRPPSGARAARGLRLASTGDDRFDAILGGGIPTESSVMVAGPPGSGKTVLILQTLFRAARAGQRSLYFTALSEPALKVIRYMQVFDFFDQELLEQSIVLADLGLAVRDGPAATLGELSRMMEKHEPQFVVIDSVRSVIDLMPDQRTARSFIYELATRSATWGTTTFLLGEYAADDPLQSPEFAVADGILRLGMRRQDLTAVRELEVVKLRGADYVSGKHFFEITPAGVFVFPRVRAPHSVDSHTAETVGRVTSGTKGLDELFGGGIPGLSTTVVQGATGSGKTIVGLQFLIEGAARGEKGMLLTLEETPEQLRAVAATLGWNLLELEQRGLLTIRYESPVELSTDRYLQMARDEVRRSGITRVVLDSLTSLSLGVTSDRRFKELVYAVAKHMRSCGATLLMTVETEQVLGAETVVGGHGVSFMADNVLQLRYVEVGGLRERGVSVLKARGVKHDTAMRLLRIGPGGPTVVGTGFKQPAGARTRKKPAARRRR
jgi:circadian clock protein KaiC